MSVSFIFIKLLTRISFIIKKYYFAVFVKFLFHTFNVKYGKNLVSRGRPVIDINLKGYMQIGNFFSMNNGFHGNRIGRQQPCIFIVQEQALLTIGDHVGMSSTAIVCWKQISIGSYTKIGGNTVIYDTDFHSLDYTDRQTRIEEKSKVKTAPVIIGEHVFIGAHSTILKGVSIGNRSIIGACSVVTKDIPPDEIWAGNPARFIKKINA